MKYILIVRKPIPFLEDWSWDVEENGGFGEKHGALERGSNGETRNSHKSSRENSKKILKIVLKTQNTHVLWLG